MPLQITRKEVNKQVVELRVLARLSAWNGSGADLSTFKENFTAEIAELPKAKNGHQADVAYRLLYDIENAKILNLWAGYRLVATIQEAAV